MQELPATLKKSYAGLVFIFLIGTGLIGLTLWGLFTSIASGADALLLFSIGVLAVAIIAGITIIQLYVYSLSYLTIADAGISAINWSTLFTKQTVEAEWYRVQDVTVEQGQGGWFAFVFNYGTLVIQTAGAAQNLRMTMVPNAEYWAAIIAALADEATDASVSA